MKFGYKSLLMFSALSILGGCNDNKEYNYNDVVCNDGNVLCYDKEQKPISGIIKKYNESNILEEVLSYKNGKRNGHFISYSENGGVIEEAFYLDGKENGSFKSYYPNGNVETEINYKNGQEDGKYAEYFENGKLKKEINYSEGKRNGSCLVYNGANENILKANYLMGVIDGDLFISINNKKIQASVNNGVFDNLEAKSDTGQSIKFVFNNSNFESYTSMMENKKNVEIKKISDNQYNCKIYENDNVIIDADAIQVEDNIKPTNVKEFFENGEVKVTYTLNQCGRLKGLYKTYNEDGSINKQIILETTSNKNNDCDLEKFHIYTELLKRNIKENNKIVNQCDVHIDTKYVEDIINDVLTMDIN